MRTRHRRPPGAWSRFFASLISLAVVAVGVPALLIVISNVGIGSPHPLPAIGSADEIRNYLDRGLSNAELTPMLIRSLLVVGWLLWAAMIAAVAVSLVAAFRGRPERHVPIIAVFAPMARWIAVGLTTVSALTPQFVHGATVESPRPFTVSRAMTPTEVETASRPLEQPARDGYGRVRASESVEKFAERILGDGGRWREIWELNQGQPIGPNGETWTTVWRLTPGSELKLPGGPTATAANVTNPIDPPTAAPDTPPSTVKSEDVEIVDPVVIVEGFAAPTVKETIGSHTVQAGDSYWHIAEITLGPGASDTEVAAYVAALINHNSPGLGYSNPTMLHPGDQVELIATGTGNDAAAAASDPGDDVYTVEAGDSYWEIAENTLPDTATNADIAQRSEDLIEINAPILGYPDPRMVQPGDVIHLTDPAEQPTTPSDPQAEPGSLPPPTAADVPVVETIPAPSEPASPTPTALPAPTHSEPASPAPTAAPGPASTLPAPSAPETVLDDTVTGAVVGATTATPPAASTVSPSGDGPENTDSPASAESDTSAFPSSRVGAISAVVAAGVASMMIARRFRASRCRPHQRPASIPTALQPDADAIMLRDVSDIDWLNLELRWLADHLNDAQRERLTIKLVRLTVERDLEVAFDTPVEGPPPDDWLAISDRVWQLTRMHDTDELGPYRDTPAVVPALATLGDSEHGRLFVNGESIVGISLNGNTATQLGWIVNTIWELAPGGIADYAEILLVDTPPIPGIDHLDNTMVCDSAAALERLADGTPDSPPSMLARRLDGREAWETTLVVLGAGVDSQPWTAPARRPDVAVIAIDGNRPDWLQMNAGDATIEIPDWNVVVDPVELDDETIDRITALLTAAEHPPVDDELIIPTTPPTHPDSEPPVGEAPTDTDAAPTVAEPWTIPNPRVMVHLLGPPHVTINDVPLDVQPQQLAALAWIAIKRETSTEALSSALWGDGEIIPDRRPRDLLHRLRKSAGGINVVGRSTDGIVRAGPDLGCDLAVVEALVDRAATHPDEWETRMSEILELADGRPFAYPTSAAASWRWADLEMLHATWENRIATVAYELAESKLAATDALAAVEIANRGLTVDPLNSALIEILMRAYTSLGAFDKARRVYESHDRALTARDLGGASDETRQLLDRLAAAAATLDSTAAAG